MKRSKNEEIILGVFSFYDPMTFSQVIIDLDKNMIKELGEFSREDLEITIKSLEKQNLIKAQLVGKETGWIRVYPKRSWWKKILSLWPL